MGWTRFLDVPGLRSLYRTLLGPAFFREGGASSEWHVDLYPGTEDPGESARLAPILGVVWPVGQEKTLRTPKAASIQGSVLGMVGEKLVRYEALLEREGDVSFVRRCDARIPIAFHGLPPGSYRFRIRVIRSGEVLFEKSGWKLQEGEERKLQPIDLDGRWKRILITVVDEDGNPVRANIQHVGAVRTGRALKGRFDLCSTDDFGQLSVRIPKARVPLTPARP